MKTTVTKALAAPIAPSAIYGVGTAPHLRAIHRFLLSLLLVAASALTAQAGPIGKGGFVITKPGKYTVLRNLTGAVPSGTTDPVGIVIKASNVELDLGGFTIAPPAGLEGHGYGILLTEGSTNVRIRNGRIRQFQFGVFGSSNGLPATAHSTFEDLQMSDCSQAGISVVAAASTFRHCRVTGGGDFGIQVLTFTGSFNELVESTVLGDGMTTGISATGLNGLVIRQCTVTGCTTGIAAPAGCKLFNNATLGCTTPITGAPLLIGVND